MNWSRIAAFSLLLFCVDVAIAAANAYGFIQLGLELGRASLLTGYAASGVVSLVVFIFFAKGQRARPYLHALVILVLSEGLGIAVLFALVGRLFYSWATPVEFVLSLCVMWVGTEIGTRLQSTDGRKGARVDLAASERIRR